MKLLWDTGGSSKARKLFVHPVVSSLALDSRKRTCSSVTPSLTNPHYTALSLCRVFHHGVQVALAETYGQRAGTLQEEQARLRKELQDVNGKIHKAGKAGETLLKRHICTIGESYDYVAVEVQSRVRMLV